MISNYVLRTQIENLNKERDVLVQRKVDLTEFIKLLGISGQAAWKHNNGVANKIDPDLLHKRNSAAKEIRKVEENISAVNGKIRLLHQEEDSDKNLQLIGIFNELFTDEQLKEIKKEANRRMRGEGSTRLSFSVKDAVEVKEESDRYRKLASDSLNKIQ